MYFLIAGILAFLVAIIHSALGEHLVFRRMRNGTIIPTNGGTLLKERHVRILWASWHIVSIFGVALGDLEAVLGCLGSKLWGKKWLSLRES